MAAPGSHRVVIAGGGFAALEAMIALRRLAGGRVELVLLCPTPDLAYPPLSVVEPFGLGEAPRSTWPRSRATTMPSCTSMRRPRSTPAGACCARA